MEKSMDFSVVKRRQLNNYIADGSVMGLQKFFADATDGFCNLIDIANGVDVESTVVTKEGKVVRYMSPPPVREQVQAMKLIMDKAFPSLKASHVINQLVDSPIVEDVDVGGLLRELNQLTEQAEEMKKREVG